LPGQAADLIFDRAAQSAFGGDGLAVVELCADPAGVDDHRPGEVEAVERGADGCGDALARGRTILALPADEAGEPGGPVAVALGLRTPLGVVRQRFHEGGAWSTNET